MSYLKNRSTKESIKLLESLSQEISRLGGPLTKQLYHFVRDHQYRELISFQIDYSWSFTSDDFLYARQIKGLFEKQDFINLGVDKEAVALDRFRESERLCHDTNIRFENLSSLSSDVNVVLYYASRKIAKILGECPCIDDLRLEFGPGANTSTDSIIANPRVKMSSRLECSTNLIPKLGELLQSLPMLCDYNDRNMALGKINEDFYLVDVDIVPGKLSFVPKNCKTHRSIVIEPSLNGLLQKGIGTYMKKRLKIAGIDLSSQEINQRLARQGSIDGLTATIDLSMASDCISRNLVWSLLPWDWACLLDCARSPVVSYKGECFEIEKFSSMGNAYTFELESLIFYALTYAVCKVENLNTPTISVYGDDIICPSVIYDKLETVLNACGFILNKDKSFATGPFRESCGADYIGGIDIRPFYLKTRISERTLYTMHNWFIRSAEFQLADFVLRLTAIPDRLFGPDGYGDGHLIGDWTPRTSRKLKRLGYEGGIFETYSLKPKYYRKVLPGDYVFPCYSIYVDDSDRNDVFVSSQEVDPDVIRGTRGFHKLSIYTLATSIFRRYQ